MLNKDVCIKCRHSEETRWIAYTGRVVCGLKQKTTQFRTVYLDLYDEPPDECPYSLEHLMTKIEGKRAE